MDGFDLIYSSPLRPVPGNSLLYEVDAFFTTDRDTFSVTFFLDLLAYFCGLPGAVEVDRAAFLRRDDFGNLEWAQMAA